MIFHIKKVPPGNIPVRHFPYIRIRLLCLIQQWSP